MLDNTMNLKNQSRTKGRRWRYLAIILLLLVLTVLFALPGMVRSFREGYSIGADIKARQGR